MILYAFERLRKLSLATPINPLPNRSNEEGSGVSVTPETPETRGCRRSWNPEAESIVTLEISSLLAVVIVRKLFPWVSP